MSENRRLQFQMLMIAAILVIAVFLCFSAPAFTSGSQAHAASTQQTETSQFKDDNGVAWIYEVLPEGGASIMGCDRIPENGLLVLPFQVDVKPPTLVFSRLSALYSPLAISGFAARIMMSLL